MEQRRLRTILSRKEFITNFLTEGCSGVMEEFDSLFEELTKEYEPEIRLSEGEKIVKQSEEMFCGYAEEEKSRREEIAMIEAKLKDLRTQLAKNKNVKNPNMKAINEKRSSKRAEIKKEIEKLKFTLDEIRKETAHRK